MPKQHQGDVKSRNDQHLIRVLYQEALRVQHCYFASELHVQCPPSELLVKPFFQITQSSIAPKKSMIFGKDFRNQAIPFIFKRNTFDLFSMSASQIAEL